MSELMAESGEVLGERALAQERGQAAAAGEPLPRRREARNLETALVPGTEPERAAERCYDFRYPRLRLLELVAGKLGLESEPLSRYNRAPTKACRRIGEECDLKPGLVKIAIEAQVSGRRNSVSLGKLLAPGRSPRERVTGEDRALRLVRNQEFAHLSVEVWNLVTRILDHWPRREDGALIDDMGREVPAATARYAKLAQLLSGAETRVVEALAADLGADEEELEFGYVTLGPSFNQRRLTRVVQEKTGYRPFIKARPRTRTA